MRTKRPRDPLIKGLLIRSFLNSTPQFRLRRVLLSPAGRPIAGGRICFWRPFLSPEGDSVTGRSICRRRVLSPESTSTFRQTRNHSTLPRQNRPPTAKTLSRNKSPSRDKRALLAKGISTIYKVKRIDSTPPAHPRSPRPRKLACRRRGDLSSEGVYVRRGCSCRSRAKTTLRTYTQNPRHLKLCECKEPITQNLAKMGNEKTGNIIYIREKMLQRALIFGTVTAYTRTDRSPVRPLTPRG